MTPHKISICHYPTTAILVDDNKDFLIQLQICLLEREHIACQFYTNPKKVLTFLNETALQENFLKRCANEVEDRDIDHILIDINVRKIHQEIYNPDRFKEVSAMVVDYAMPAMNGLDLCRQIKNHSIRKAILTGEASKDIAIQAFNEGSIDKFLMKNQTELMLALVDCVRQLQNKYFYQLTDSVLQQLAPDATLKTLLSDPVFVKFFINLYKEKNCTEHYLLDEHGSFLLLDKNGTPTWLIIKSEHGLHDLYLQAEIEKAPQEVQSALKDKTKVPYFHTEADLKTPPTQWQKYLHPATALKGDQTYFYAVLTGPNAYHINHEKISSYEKYFATI
jgi:CheY-like chemotaxis protein